MKMLLTNWGIRRPWLMLLLIAMVTALFATQFPRVKFDNDPENMLSEKEHVRLFHHQVKEKYALYDFVIVGIVNESDADGVFNVGTLGRLHGLTEELIGLGRGPDGKPLIKVPARAGRPARELALDMAPESRWSRLLNVAFNHDPNDLFDGQGSSAIIARELIAPSVVDNIRQSELGSLKIEYLMETPPASREMALAIRDDAMGNPLYSGTLVSKDEKAVCIYIPISEKRYSYNVANLVRRLTADWPAEDQVYITGLPVAEDTFGVEMLVQMAISAPLAGLAIFLLMFLFFRQVPLIVAPMLVAVVSVICTMGLLIGLGFDVHIMSSMIAIFLMPIAVADSVHILSEFYDSYHRFGDKAKTIRYVIGHLFRPMLYTSLTTMAGFASLATTPIPPVQVFGLHVAFGVALAWVLSMVLIPAYIMVAVPEKSLAKVGAAGGKKAAAQSGGLTRMLEWLGGFSYRYWRSILVATLVVMGISAYGIARIEVNDNPMKWFTAEHEIRVADEVLNRHFAGTYTAYLTLASPGPQASSFENTAARLRQGAKERFAAVFPAATERFIATVDRLQPINRNVTSADLKKHFVALAREAEAIDREVLSSWNRLADAVNYLEPEGLNLAALEMAIGQEPGVEKADRRLLLEGLRQGPALTGMALQDRALEICDRYAGLSFVEFTYTMEAELNAPLFKRPEMLRYVERLQEHLLANGIVGKSSSAADALKKAAYELTYVAPPADASERERAEFEGRNRSRFAIPATAASVGQVYVQLEGMKKKDSLFHLVTRNYEEANLWVQLKGGDNRDMEAVTKDVALFMEEVPPPLPLMAEWAGLTYLNVVWQDKMVNGMIGSLAGSFVVVMIMMMLLFRSPLYGVLAMIPLSVTISFIYGLIGLVGKDYDMPVAILSALTLGLSVDFAIHFLQRAREMQRQSGSWRVASRQMFKEPAMAISRNAIVISIGFTPLLFAPLVPYKTVGFFLATIMAVSWLATIFILPAMITMLGKRLFREEEQPED